MQVAPRNWLHGSMGLSRSFAGEWNALAAVDLFGLQSMQQLGGVIRERDVVGPLPEHPEVAAFTLRHGLYHCMALTAELPHSGLMFFVSIYRPPTRPEFSDGETVLFGEFVPHLLQQWHHRLQRLQSDTPGRPWDRFALARPSGELLFAGLRISRALGEASPGWNGTHLPPAVAQAPRELSVAMLYAQGHSHKDIAATLGLTPATVRTYLRTAYAALGVSN